jgi:hypothetical protein
MGDTLDAHAEQDDLSGLPVARGRPVMLDMEVVARRQDQECRASITCMIRHYVARRVQVIEGHPHNADERAQACLDGTT